MIRLFISKIVAILRSIPENQAQVENFTTFSLFPMVVTLLSCALPFIFAFSNFVFLIEVVMS